MGAGPAAVGAFYRRFEDEVLGYFLARGAQPDVAADLTAETFAAALPSRHWQRLGDAARATLEASAHERRVVTTARRRRRLPPLVLTGDAVTRIATVEHSPFALARELHLDEQHGVRARVIEDDGDGQPASGLRASDAVVLRAAADPSEHRADAPRMPQLERDLVAAAARVGRERQRAALAAAALAAAVLVLVAVTGGSGDDAGEPSPVTATVAKEAQPPPSAEDEITRAASDWAVRFGLVGHESCVEPMTQPACERVACDRVSGPLENCVPLSRALRRSFRTAYVRDVVVDGNRGAALFSNGVIVDFVRVRGGLWMVHGVGSRSGWRLYHEAKIVLAANAWARFFAGSGARGCPQSMTQSACEQATCESLVTGPLEDCVPVPAGVKRSFHAATVRDVVALRGRRAAVRFSNGQVVALFYVNDAGGRWLVDGFGRGAARGPG